MGKTIDQQVIEDANVKFDSPEAEDILEEGNCIVQIEEPIGTSGKKMFKPHEAIYTVRSIPGLKKDEFVWAVETKKII